MQVSLIFPSSQPKEQAIEKAMTNEKDLGFTLSSVPPSRPSPIPFHAGSIADRTQELLEALTSPKTQAVLCGRGGYGASDLLEHLPWQTLKTVPWKWFVGFSDSTALISALYSQLGWKSIHGPLIATDSFDPNREDARGLFEILSGRKVSGEIAVQPLTPAPKELYPSPMKSPIPREVQITARSSENQRAVDVGVNEHWKRRNNDAEIRNPLGIEGVLIGGCMSVLVSLIGTPYYPVPNEPTILFLEDITETPQRILRYWNQFTQSGVLQNAVALVLGRFVDIPNGDNLEYANATWIKNQIALRSNIPVFTSEEFGHGNAVNHPLVVGARAKLLNHTLTWNL